MYPLCQPASIGCAHWVILSKCEAGFALVHFPALALVNSVC